MLNKYGWLFKIPITVFFVFAFYLTHLGEKGDIQNPFLREKVFPILRTITGGFTNLKFKLRGPVSTKNKIVILEVSSSDLEILGRWPWHRDVIAFTLEKTLMYQPKVIGLDVVFSEPDTRVPDELKEMLIQKNLGDSIKQFETDLLLADTFKNNADKIVTGWAADKSCQPGFSTESECPLFHPEFIETYPKDIDQFSIKNFTHSEHYDPKKIPLISYGSIVKNLTMFNDVTKYSGSFDVAPDPDGYVRRISLFGMINGKPFPSLALGMAQAGLNENMELRLNSQNRVESIKFQKSNFDIPTTPLGVMEINFHGPSFSYPYIRVTDLLSDSEEIIYSLNNNSRLPFDCQTCSEVKDALGKSVHLIHKSELLKDAYVLLGVTAIGVYDMRAFPFDSNTAGVEGHANILDNLLSHNPLIPTTSGQAWIWIILAMTIGSLIFSYLTHITKAIGSMIVFVAFFGLVFLIDQKFLFEQNVNVNTSFLYLEILSVYFFTLIMKYLTEERNKKFIKGAFSKYVAPAIVDSILKDPSKLAVGGEKRELTIMFSDIRSFTSFSEKMDPKQLTGFLNQYLGLMTEIVFETEGTLDKYIGDAVMAFWGAPVHQTTHAFNACKAAVFMMKTLNENKQRFNAEFGIDVNIGIGINTGAVSVGNMGSDRIFEYTVIGDDVNLASRTEGLTKPYGVSILTTRATIQSIISNGQKAPPHRVLDLVKVKGKKNSVEMIQVLDKEYPEEALIKFDEARILYAKQEWEAAINKFKAVSSLIASKLGHPDSTSEMFIERCEIFRQSPPNADWDGSWEMTSK